MERSPQQAVEDVLTKAGESRSREELCTFSCWSSHSQFKLLLEEAVRSLESNSLNLASCMASISYANNEMAELIQALGSAARCTHRWRRHRPRVADPAL